MKCQDGCTLDATKTVTVSYGTLSNVQMVDGRHMIQPKLIESDFSLCDAHIVMVRLAAYPDFSITSVRPIALDP